MPTNSCSCQQNPSVVIPPVSPFVCPDECCAEILASTCLVYDGPPIPAFGITTNQSLTQVIQNLAFGSGGEGGPSPIYQGPPYSTVTVQNFPAGTYIYGMSYDQLLGNIYAPYVHPAFTSFTMNQTVNVLVGTIVSGTKTFTATYSNIQNIVPNSLEIIQENNQTILGSNLPLSSININIGSHVFTFATSLSWQGRATKTLNYGYLNSNLFTVRWMYKVFAGQLTEAVLDPDFVAAFSVFNDLKSNFSGIYNFVETQPTLTYRYFCFPDAFGAPSQFKDYDTNFEVAMADTSTNAFYNNVDTSGNSYGLIELDFPNAVNIPYRVYRTYYPLGGAIKIIVS